MMGAKSIQWQRLKVDTIAVTSEEIHTSYVCSGSRRSAFFLAHQIPFDSDQCTFGEYSHSFGLA